MGRLSRETRSGSVSCDHQIEECLFFFTTSLNFPQRMFSAKTAIPFSGLRRTVCLACPENVEAGFLVEVGIVDHRGPRAHSSWCSQEP